MNQIPNIEDLYTKIDDYYRNNFDESQSRKKMFITELLHHQLQKAREEAQAEYKQFVLNVLDGVDIADGQCNTKAIRFALESRIIHSELDQDNK